MKTDAHWEKIGMRPHHGIALPLFSLRTKKNCGIGEFLDLIPLIEWCASLGFDCLQLLPLNDIGQELSPYNALSSTALDPIYLSLWDLPDGNGGLESFIPYRETPRLCRSEILDLKLKWLRAYFERTFSSLSKTPSYRAFLSSTPWLLEYARFKAFKTAFQGKHWKDWPSHSQENQSEIDFHMFLQYHSFSQFKKVRTFANQHSLFLVGDAPYLLSPDSADVWAHPGLFKRNLDAGAPPDPYNPLGQNWGFPLFDWDAMEKDGYAWWKKRLATIGSLYHIYRIDHVVGFFRIWAIAHGHKPSEGSFIPADPALWVNLGRTALEMMLSACPLLPIAEDLGTIPPLVYPVLRELGIPDTKILRGEGSTPYSCYEPFSLTTVSTPDMEPMPLWWQKFPEEAKALCRLKEWPYEPTLSGERQLALLRDAHHTASYFHINLLQEYLYPFPDLSWPTLENEQINVPGTLLASNWTYRFRPFLEELVQHKPLANAIHSILAG